MSKITKNTDTRIKLHDQQGAVATRLGGEHRPFNYPRLYQIQAGDWRISYAVEQNRLAILVLEVLKPEGSVLTVGKGEEKQKEKMAKKMRVKLVDLAEKLAGEGTPPEDMGKKLKIKLLDLSQEMGGKEVAQEEHDEPELDEPIDAEVTSEEPVRKSKIKIMDPTTK